MKNFAKKLFCFLLIFFITSCFFTISVSSLDIDKENQPFVKVVCGDYNHIFHVSNYGNSMNKTLAHSLKIAGLKAGKNKKATVYVSKGEYSLKNTLLIFSNTTLVAENCTFKGNINQLRNGFDDNALSAIGYLGAENIEIIGGIWDLQGDYKIANTTNQNFTHSTFRFAHCKNIKVTNVVFKNNYSGHDIELGGVDNCIIDSCTFKNDKSVNKFKGVKGKEAVQIDLNTEKAVPYIPDYDKTCSKNIKVKNSVFKNKFCGIGSHNYDKDRFYSNIEISDNKFINIINYGINGIHWKNVNLKNNIYINTKNNHKY